MPKRSSIDPYYRHMKESVLQTRVIGLARENGFVLPPIDPDSAKPARRRPFVFAYHTYNSERSVPGFPDLVLVHPETGRTIVAELKREGQYPTPEQRRWLDAFRLNPAIEVYVWKPHDLPEISRILGGVSSRLPV